jgi:hypothetical protein
VRGQHAQADGDGSSSSQRHGWPTVTALESEATECEYVTGNSVNLHVSVNT